MNDSVKEKVEALLGATRPGAPGGSRLPPEKQEVVAEYLRAGLTMAETARRAGVSRDRVRTIKYALFGTTLAEVRAFKRRSKVDA